MEINRTMIKKVEIEWGGRPFSLETGRIAKQANGAVMVQYRDSIILVTAVAVENRREDLDYFPLTVDYQEKTFSAGKIPGGFFKREGRSSEKEIITSRCIDRPIRPLFPEGYNDEVQIIATILSADPEIESDILAIIGASAALEVSDIPFQGPVAGVRVGRVQEQLICNPTLQQIEEGDLNLIVAGSREAVVMVEGGAKELPEHAFVEAIEFAHHSIQKILDLQEELKAALGKPKKHFQGPEISETLISRIREAASAKIREAVEIPQKLERYRRLDEIKEEVKAALLPDFEGEDKKISNYLEELKKEIIRKMVIGEKRRIDGRSATDIRPISCEVGILPRTHGSALFTRGETQVLATTTLGTSDDEQRLDSLLGETFKSFMLHYNFPPFSVAEAKFLRGPSRRDIGHGNLAERSIIPVLPNDTDFPYTIRIVSEVLESNGSSSMATVCGATLSLMGGGVPIKAPVAGIALGLIKEGEEVAILSDILGDEDHIGDMDFKVAGTREGITGFQMDIKISGITSDIMEKALYQAREGRMYILDKMQEVISEPRPDISMYAPRIQTIQISPEKIKDVIGPGGKIIRSIVDQTGVKINIEDSGDVCLASANMESLQKAIKIIQDLTREAEPGEIYLGTVKKITDFGAFVEILPGTEGLIHISQLENRRVEKVRDVLNEGDEVMVKVLSIDRMGKIRLSRKEALGHEPKNRVE
jgi:polyribonucleotide nucleotidyltransferase